MRKKDILRCLRSDDDELITQISQAYPGLTKEQTERLYQRIRQNLNIKCVPKFTAAPEIRSTVRRVRQPRCSYFWVENVAACASCILVIGATLAGLFWMKANGPALPPHTETISAADSVLTPDPSGYFGKRYAAEHLTSSGTLWVTVTDATWENERCRVTVLLESKHAVSIADETMGEPELFFAENFLLTGPTSICSPCGFETDGEVGATPNTIVLASGKSCTVTLWYNADPSTHWRFAPVNNQIYTSVN